MPLAGSQLSLSPSRAADFVACPLLYRFRAIDRLPEPPSPAAVRGTLVHAVLEGLFDHPPAQRVPATAHALVEPLWQNMQETEPDLAAMFERPADLEAWLSEVGTLIEAYFRLEDPSRYEPAGREVALAHALPDGLQLKGVVDRLDIAASGAIRIVDYKSGRAPGPGFEAKAMFQLRVYALLCWRLRGSVPAALQLYYLGSGEVLTYRPDEPDLLATETRLRALGEAIARAVRERDFRPRPGRLCNWCVHHRSCPAQGGTLPAWPEPRTEACDASPAHPDPGAP